MGSMDVDGVQATPGVGDEVIDRNHGLRRAPVPVWVLLGELYQRPPGQPAHRNAAGLDLSGRAHGLLKRWIPTYDGDWFALVTYAIPYADPTRRAEHVQDQLVPAYAVRKIDTPGQARGEDTGST